MQRWIRLRHIQGLPNTEKYKSVTMKLKNETIAFSTKQLITYDRIHGCEIFRNTIQIPGNPLGSAVSYGILSLIIGAFIGGITIGSGALGIVLGVIGAIVGAIKGLQPSTKNHHIISIGYKSVNGSLSNVELVLTETSSKRALFAIANYINQKVGHGSQFVDSNKSYEI